MRFLLVFVLLVALGACQGQRQSSERGDSQTQTDTTADSLHPPTTDPGPSPSTLRARVTVQRCREGDEEYRCQFTIQKIVAYGAAVPALDDGTSVNVRVAGHWFDDSQTGGLSEIPTIGTPLEVTLSHYEQPEFAEASVPLWQLEAIH